MKMIMINISFKHTYHTSASIPVNVLDESISITIGNSATMQVHLHRRLLESGSVYDPAGLSFVSALKNKNSFTN